MKIIKLIIPDDAIAMNITLLINKGFDELGAHLDMNTFGAKGNQMIDGSIIDYETEMKKK